MNKIIDEHSLALKKLRRTSTIHLVFAGQYFFQSVFHTTGRTCARCNCSKIITNTNIFIKNNTEMNERVELEFQEI